MAPWAMPIVGEPRDTKIAPRNDLEAIASLPFMLAAALVEGRVDLATLAPTTIHNTEIRALAYRVACEADPSLGTGFDGRMEIIRSDGQTPLARRGPDTTERGTNHRQVPGQHRAPVRRPHATHCFARCSMKCHAAGS